MSDDNAALRTSEDGTRCYRLRRYYLIVGLIGTVSFFSWGVVSTCAAYWNIDGSFALPTVAALIFGTFWSCFTLFGMWLILAYYSFRLYVTDSGVTEVGIIGSRTIEFSNVNRVRWRVIPRGGSVAMHGNEKRITIGFANFTPAERDELIDFCRNKFCPDLQENWSRFVEQLKEPTPERKRRSGVSSSITLLLLAFFAGTFTYFWFLGLGGEYLVLGIVNALAPLWYLHRRRLHQRRTAHESLQDKQVA